MRWPAPTIRLRLTVLYGVVFLITGAVLLTLGYLLVRHNLDAGANFREVRQQLQRLGLMPADRHGAVRQLVQVRSGLARGVGGRRRSARSCAATRFTGCWSSTCSRWA